MKKGLVLTLMALVCLFFSYTVAYAGEVVASNTPTVDAVLEDEEEDEDVVEEEEAVEEEDEVADTGVTDSNYAPSYNTVKPVSMAAAEQRVARKGSEALSMTQLVAYIIISIFLVIALIRLAAAHATGGGNNDPALKNASFGAIVVCCVCYVLTYASPFILEFFKNWIMA